ncbi:MAG: bifunctional UDP-N-acetylglucosamine diphosphorylase/glucosamine-1-phosphate N-acetyltransferase GlmU [Actinomycetota bacterium]|nr:bifunctional UDP-N-acetylglucosamine diphosphorylase/glucosamine-1-phosphate N-acetyltransferase GlmU [Actinomycetota bacterium]
MNLAVIILAAGEGTRMKSDLPKVLQPVAGRPMLAHVLAACEQLGSQRRLVVIGHKYEQVLAWLGGDTGTVHQHEQRGTGHAVLITEPLMGDFEGPVLVLAGDIPLVKPETLKALVDIYAKDKPAAVMTTAILKDPFGYGRVIRDEAGVVDRIVEEKDASVEERAIKEINAGIYCFDRRRLYGALALIKDENHQSQFYLTDVVAILRSQGETVLAHQADSNEIMGVNSRAELARAEAIMQSRLRRGCMDNGATFVLPETTYLTADVQIEPDAIILPGCYLEGKTRIGRGASIGPGARIIDSVIGAGATVQYAVLNGCVAEDEVNIGPYCSIRPGTILRRGAKAGSFVEIKKSEIGRGSKVPHLSYIGDAVIGEDVNVGAGSITCNYDGAHKHRTVIEDGAFIGSDTMLVAPVRIGRGAVTGAGSSITSDVPPDSLAVERSEQKVVTGWAKERRSKEK